MSDDQYRNDDTARNKPVEVLRDGPLKVSIFRNQSERGEYHSLDPSRIYTDDDGNVREAKTLRGTEALRMAHLLTKGYDRIGEFKTAMKQERKPARGRERDTDRRR